jgi:hypothetical protein
VQKGEQYVKDKIFTTEEITEVGKLAKTNTQEDVAAKFGMHPSTFRSSRMRQPELDKAFQNGVNARPTKNGRLSKFYTPNPVLQTEKGSIRSDVHLDAYTDGDALRKYRKLVEERRRMDLIMEIREVELM